MKDLTLFVRSVRLGAGAGFTALLAGASLLAGALFLVGATAFSQEQGGLDEEHIECIRAAANEAGPVGQWAVVRRVTAPFQRVEALLEAFSREFAAQGLDEALLTREGFESKAVVIVYQDPRGMAEVPMAIGLTVPGALRPRDPLTLERFLEPVAVRCSHMGPYERLNQVFEEIEKALPEGSRPTFPVWLRLMNDPRTVEPDLIHTDLVVPVVRPPALTDDERKRVADAVGAAGRVEYLLASQRFVGPIERIGEFLKQFMAAFEEQGLGESLAGAATAPLALVYSNPDLVREVEMEIGLPLVRRADVKEPLRLREVGFDRTVLYTHAGEYERLSAIHSEISQVARTAAQAPLEPTWPVALRLLTDPDTVATTDEIKTQFLVPLGAVGGG
ncbi:MAG: GyrI-like domain-containing protein [Verrucomicrobiae bacterium]|nr:GyrI-like domain-containing protein [Verrucomicrobiae bacterium]